VIARVRAAYDRSCVERTLETRPPNLRSKLQIPSRCATLHRGRWAFSMAVAKAWLTRRRC